jgi:hypothetical protein
LFAVSQVIPRPDLKVAAHRVLEARAALEIAVKRYLNVENLLDVAHGQWLPLVDGKGLRRAHRVLDLPPVELVPGQGIEVLLGEAHELYLLVDPDALDEYLEDCFLGPLVEVVVPERNVDA